MLLAPTVGIQTFAAGLPDDPAFTLPPIPTEFPELGDLQLPQIEKVRNIDILGNAVDGKAGRSCVPYRLMYLLLQVVLRNGLRVFLVQDRDVPLVKATLLFPGGLRASGADKVKLIPKPIHGCQ